MPASHRELYLTPMHKPLRKPCMRASSQAGRPVSATTSSTPWTTRRRIQRSPDRQRSIERRRRLAASGPLPPQLACHFTTSEIAVLRIVADEVRHRGYCDRSIPELAARAGTCATTVRNALREARLLGLVSIRERRVDYWRSKPNVVTIIRTEWRVWLRLADKGGGYKKTKLAHHNTKKEAVGEQRMGRNLPRASASEAAPKCTERKIYQ
jgi:hypothetical protein